MRRRSGRGRRAWTRRSRSCAGCSLGIRSASTRISRCIRRRSPPPSQPIPIVVGSRSDAALHRAGRLGDGWFGIWVSPSRYAASLEAMHLAASDTRRAVVAERTERLDRRTRRSCRSSMRMWHRRWRRSTGCRFERFERWSPATRHDAGARRLPRPVRRSRLPRVQPDHQLVAVQARDRRGGGDPPAHRGSLNAAGEGAGRPPCRSRGSPLNGAIRVLSTPLDRRSQPLNAAGDSGAWSARRAGRNSPLNSAIALGPDAVVQHEERQAEDPEGVLGAGHRRRRRRRALRRTRARRAWSARRSGSM